MPTVPNPKKKLILEGLRAGASPSQLARDLGLSKNAVIGIKNRAGLCESTVAVPTLWSRMQALHEAMDRVLAETMPVLERDREAAVQARLLAASKAAKARWTRSTEIEQREISDGKDRSVVINYRQEATGRFAAINFGDAPWIEEFKSVGELVARARAKLRGE